MTKPRILIVGAGPTGMVLALWLARSGVRARIIDRAAGPGETSRAVAVQARTLEFYRQLGFADKVVASGIQVKEVIMRAGDQHIYRAPLGKFGEGLSPFPFVLSYPQDDHERLLIECLRQDGIEVERQTELIGLTQSAAGVSATLRTPHGDETVEADHVCGCDGAGSAVRHALGVGFPGGTYAAFFYVADTDATGPLTGDGINPCVYPDGFCLVIPIRSTGRVRLIGIVPAAIENKEQVTWEDIAPSILRYSGLTVSKVHWFSTYHVHHRVAPRFRIGRAYLAGDAAHIHSPVGGQGMNTGLGDAINLAWKLAAVVQGRGSPALLDTYEPERIAFARRLVATTDQIFQILVNRSWPGWFLRGTVFPRLFPILARIPFLQRYFFRTVSQILINYRHSRLSSGSIGRVHGGDRLPWVPSESGDNFQPLASLDWQVHVHGTARDVVHDAARRAGVPLYEFPWSESAHAAGLMRDAIYLVRPDGYVAFVGPPVEANRIGRLLDDWGIRPKATEAGRLP